MKSIPMLLQIHPDNPQGRKVEQVAEVIQNGGVVVFPTDTVYALACSLDSKQAFNRICKIRNIDPKKATFSMLATSIAQAAPFLDQLSTPAFRLLNSHLPGPFTFIVNSGKQMSAHMRKGRNTIGLRVPEHAVTRAIIDAVGAPIVSTSLRSEDEILEYHNDPDEIFKEIGKIVECVVDSGPGSFYPSTVVDLTSGEFEVVRQGKGELQI